MTSPSSSSILCPRTSIGCQDLEGIVVHFFGAHFFVVDVLAEAASSGADVSAAVSEDAAVCFEAVGG